MCGCVWVCVCVCVWSVHTWHSMHMLGSEDNFVQSFYSVCLHLQSGIKARLIPSGVKCLHCLGQLSSLTFLVLWLYFLIGFECSLSHTQWFNALLLDFYSNISVCTKLATFDLVLYISFSKAVSSLMYIFDYSRKQVGSFTNWYESTCSLLVMLNTEHV